MREKKWRPKGTWRVRCSDTAAHLILVCPPKSHTWNLRFLYVTVSTLKPMAEQGRGFGRSGDELLIEASGSASGGVGATRTKDPTCVCVNVCVGVCVCEGKVRGQTNAQCRVALSLQLSLKRGLVTIHT
jgi:hypothetical protein